jgi:hypothetical protein
MAFSPDAAWLVSVGREPERSVVMWNVYCGEAVAIGHTEGPVCAVAWCSHAANPSFVTVGGDKALVWTLEPTHISQRTLSLPQVCPIVLLYVIAPEIAYEMVPVIPYGM